MSDWQDQSEIFNGTAATGLKDARSADGNDKRGTTAFVFGEELADLADQKGEPAPHQIIRDGRQYVGSWEDIVREMRDANGTHVGRTLREFMIAEAARGESLSGVEIPSSDPESFIRGSATAGLLRIVK